MLKICKQKFSCLLFGSERVKQMCDSGPVFCQLMCAFISICVNPRIYIRHVIAFGRIFIHLHKTYKIFLDPLGHVKVNMK